jgi:hypothetical protein
MTGMVPSAQGAVWMAGVPSAQGAVRVTGMVPSARSPNDRGAESARGCSGGMAHAGLSAAPLSVPVDSARWVDGFG